MTARFVLALLALALAVSPTQGALGQGQPRAAQASPLSPDPGGPTYLPLIRTGPAGITAPQLKWQRGGCYASWCETGWYASPAAADLDGDGAVEVVGAAYTVFSLDGRTGKLEWRASPEDGRVWPGVGLADLEGDGRLEIVTGHGNGSLNVFNADGSLRLTRQPTPGNELRSLALDDLDRNGQVEILVASTRSDDQWTVYRADGGVYPGRWPQHGPDSAENGYAAGAYNENIGAADLDGDGRGEIIGPSDVHYITAYEDDGTQTRAGAVFNQIENIRPTGTPKVWSQVGVHVDPWVDLRGYADCGVEHRPNFANSAPAIGNLDGNGRLEVVVVGNVYNCGTAPYTDLYEMPFVFNPDRTRWQVGPYDWSALPAPDGLASPLSEDYERIENSVPNPVLADLDGNGQLEILYPSYDGRLHAYWLDKREHGSWPYAVTRPGEGFLRFASEPAVADLDGDGQAEVIFASWTEKGSGASGTLTILSAAGERLAEVTLPQGDDADWNGALAAPTLADIDQDGELEAVLNTAAAGIAAYDLPGTGQARVLWGTGRGSFLRQGRAP